MTWHLTSAPPMGQPYTPRTKTKLFTTLAGHAVTYHQMDHLAMVVGWQTNPQGAGYSTVAMSTTTAAALMADEKLLGATFGPLSMADAEVAEDEDHQVGIVFDTATPPLVATQEIARANDLVAAITSGADPAAAAATLGELRARHAILAEQVATFEASLEAARVLLRATVADA